MERVERRWAGYKGSLIRPDPTVLHSLCSLRPFGSNVERHEGGRFHLPALLVPRHSGRFHLPPSGSPRSLGFRRFALSRRAFLLTLVNRPRPSGLTSSLTVAGRPGLRRCTERDAALRRKRPVGTGPGWPLSLYVRRSHPPPWLVPRLRRIVRKESGPSMPHFMSAWEPGPWPFTAAPLFHSFILHSYHSLAQRLRPRSERSEVKWAVPSVPLHSPPHLIRLSIHPAGSFRAE